MSIALNRDSAASNSMTRAHGRADRSNATADEPLHARIRLNEEPERLGRHDDGIDLIAGIQEGSGHMAHPLSILRVSRTAVQTRPQVPSAAGPCWLPGSAQTSRSQG
jgi:hypothetical protein